MFYICPISFVSVGFSHVSLMYVKSSGFLWALVVFTGVTSFLISMDFVLGSQANKKWGHSAADDDMKWNELGNCDIAMYSLYQLNPHFISSKHSAEKIHAVYRPPAAPRIKSPCFPLPKPTCVGGIPRPLLAPTKTPFVLVLNRDVSRLHRIFIPFNSNCDCLHEWQLKIHSCA